MGNPGGYLNEETILCLLDEMSDEIFEFYLLVKVLDSRWDGCIFFFGQLYDGCDSGIGIDV